MLIKKSLQEDDHANPSLYIAEDGHVTIYYSAHCGKNMYYRTTENPEDITSFGAESELPDNTDGTFGYTYPNPIYMNNEKLLYLFWRGGNFKPNFSTSSDGDTWTEPRTLISGDGARPYIKFASHGEDTIWFAYTDGHPNNVYLSRSVNGVFEIDHWHTPDFGITWTSTAITARSSRNNVRPILTRRYDNEPAILLWMNGDYVHYTQYRTALKMKLLKQLND